MGSFLPGRNKTARQIRFIALITGILTSLAHAQTFPGDDAERMNMTMAGYLQISDNPKKPGSQPPFTDIVVAGNHAYTGSFGGEVYVIDISDPSAMSLVTTFQAPAAALDLKISGDLLALGLEGEDAGMTLVDISDPTAPEILSSFSVEGWFGSHNLYLYNNRAYLAHAYTPGVTVIDISDPANPVMTGHWDNGIDHYSNVAHDIFVKDDLAFVSDIVAGEGGLVILDVSDPDNPVTVSDMPIPEGIHNAWKQGDYVYFNQEFGGWNYPLHVADISDPSNPIDLGTFRINRTHDRNIIGPHNLWAEGDLLYWAYYDSGVRVFDISAPHHPVEIGYHTAVATWGTQTHTDGLIYSVDNWQGGISAMRFHKPSHAIRKVELGQPVGIQGRTRAVGVQAWTAPLGGEGAIDRLSVSVAGLAPGGDPLTAAGDNRYDGRLVLPEGMPSGRHQVQVRLEDDQGRLYPFNVPFDLFPSRDLPVLSADPAQSWTLERPEDPVWTTFEGRQALTLPPSINVTLLPAKPQDRFGYRALRFAYHPGDVEEKVTNNLRMTFNSAPLPIYNSLLEQPLVDMERKEWQVIEVPLEVGVAFRLDDVFEAIKVQGRLNGTSYLASIELITSPPPPLDTAVREERTDSQPEAFSVEQNYPNPFNSSTVIRFDLATASAVELAVYNMAGQRVATLVSGQRQAGRYSINWDGRDMQGQDLASGLYLYRLSADGWEQTRKLLLLR